MHAATSSILSVVMIALGIAFLVRTASLGGGEIGIILGVGFLAAGIGRLYVNRRMR